MNYKALIAIVGLFFALAGTALLVVNTNKTAPVTPQNLTFQDTFTLQKAPEQVATQSPSTVTPTKAASSPALIAKISPTAIPTKTPTPTNAPTYTPTPTIKIATQSPKIITPTPTKVASSPALIAKISPTAIPTKTPTPSKAPTYTPTPTIKPSPTSKSSPTPVVIKKASVSAAISQAPTATLKPTKIAQKPTATLPTAGNETYLVAAVVGLFAVVFAFLL